MKSAWSWSAGSRSPTPPCRSKPATPARRAGSPRTTWCDRGLLAGAGAAIGLIEKARQAQPGDAELAVENRQRRLVIGSVDHVARGQHPGPDDRCVMVGVGRPGGGHVA